ncbi:lipopolysaccharide biosynthesis protein [Oleiharenicola lentus]|uniref:lipopolysaccharide biosynthesis protein n=1 Tax=Oleiharenicola lentus TaxID=2508720 RepID=UPI0013E93DC7|nr:lipopolysaccharide biosynthesis protein [Oleiharenicola lentus]
MSLKISPKSQTKAEMLHAAKWSAAARVTNQGMSAVVTFLLAGLLGPEAFGTVALAYLTVTFFEIIAGMGFNSALVQNQRINDHHLNSVFWLNLALSSALMLLIWFGSGLFAALAKAPEVQPILGWLALLLPIQGLTVVQVAVMNRNMAFRALAIRSTIAVMIGGVLGLTLAFLGFGVWALVAQHLVRELVSVLLLWGQSDWRPRMSFSWASVCELFNFAGKAVVGQFGTFFQNQFDSIAIGLFLGPTALGLYRLAERLVELNLSLFPRALQSVSLSHFSRLQHDHAELNRNFVFGVKLNSLGSFPGLAFLAGAGSLVLSVFGPEWGEAEGVMAMLAIVGMAKAIILFVGPTLQAVSQPGIVSIMTWAGAVANALAITAVATLLHEANDSVRMMGISFARVVVFCGFLTPIMLLQIKRVTNLSLITVARAVLPSFLTAGIVFGSQYLIKLAGLWQYFSNAYISLAAATSIALVIVVVATRSLDRPLWKSLITGLSER